MSQGKAAKRDSSSSVESADSLPASPFNKPTQKNRKSLGSVVAKQRKSTANSKAAKTPNSRKRSTTTPRKKKSPVINGKATAVKNNDESSPVFEQAVIEINDNGDGEEPDNVDGSENEYVVEKIIDKRIDSQGAVFYRVKWEGYNEISWEPLEHLSNCPELIEQFEADLKVKEPTPSVKVKTNGTKREPKAPKSAKKQKGENGVKANGISSATFYAKKPALISTENTEISTETGARDSIASSATYGTPRSSLGGSTKPHRLNDSITDEAESQPAKRTKASYKARGKRRAEATDEEEEGENSEGPTSKYRRRWVMICLNEPGQEACMDEIREFLRERELRFKELFED